MKKVLAKIMYTRFSFSQLDLANLAHPIRHACLSLSLNFQVGYTFFFPSTHKILVFRIKTTTVRNFSQFGLSLFEGQFPSVNCSVWLFCLLVIFFWSPKDPRGAPGVTVPMTEQCICGDEQCQHQKPPCEDNEFRHFRNQPASENGT